MFLHKILKCSNSQELQPQLSPASTSEMPAWEIRMFNNYWGTWKSERRKEGRLGAEKTLTQEMTSAASKIQ